MATATLTMTEGEAARLQEARKQLADAERTLKATADQITEVNDQLAALQAARATECEARVRGNPKAAPERFDAKIQAARDRLCGLEAVKRGCERDVSDARANFYNLSAAQGQVEQERLLQKEDEDLKRLISQVGDAIETRDRAAKTVLEGIASLRAWKYLAESHRRLGVDSAQRFERISNGMRP